MDKEKILKEKIHSVLAHSYVIQFLALILGMLLDFVTPTRIFQSSSVAFLGGLFILFGSWFVFWSQQTSRNMKKENLSVQSFIKGPYRFSRTPTHWGLFFLILGFGIVANTTFVVLCTILAFIISKLTFLKQEEDLLEKKYGEHYREYRKLVKF